MSLELLIFGIDFRLELSRLFVKASFLFPPPFKTRFNIALFLFQVVQPAHKLRYTHQFIASIQFLIGTNLFRCLFKGLQLAGNFRLDIVDPQEVSCRIIELSQGLFLRRRYLAMPAVSSKWYAGLRDGCLGSHQSCSGR